MIYLTRHGETQSNREGRFQGRGDAPLTERGVAQAKAMGARLAQIAAAEGGAWRIVCSPLGRTRHTAALIASAMGLAEPQLDERLIEISYGDLEGLVRPEIDARWPHLAGVRGIFMEAPNAEPMPQVKARAAAWLAEARDEVAANGSHVVAIAHAGIGRVIRALVAGLPDEALRTMETPQDAFHRLHEAYAERIDCAPLPERTTE